MKLIYDILYRNMYILKFWRQGLMFGYATDETEQCMPLTVVLAHQLNHKLAQLRRDGVLWWARPDTKTQVSELSGNGKVGRSAPKTERACNKLGLLWENT